ncbi:GntR family transcriptional regulator [Pikeienuella piscinae]|uniref:GntR family transcriptional regulator n=1 Tax=Pikeienuella piscinae TaxID=2748098 RepID=A0A7L5C363_9RHOB|nr:GntR family transcriptional regulator [Pikeienuella piscinae]QIE56684.1 GntR family transcriptional regulator [Pikeienuella piscinae]
MKAVDAPGSDAIAQVHQSIRQRIMTGDLPSGTHLAAAEIAAEFRVSRTPAREALLLLAGEGFVEVIPNRGAYVRNWSREDIEEVFELRALLEPHAAWRAASRATAEDIAELEKLADEMEEASRSRAAADRDRLAFLNDRFHRQIVSMAGGVRLERFINATYELVLQAWTFGSFSERDMVRSMMHHRDLIAAFRTGDAALARSVMKNHILTARRRYVDNPASSDTGKA